MKKFFAVIGNPPYQDETIGNNKTFAPPIYDKFIDESYEIAENVELIHPARFLVNAGSTPKMWNKKMLSDEHFKILHFEEDSSKIFPNTDIKLDRGEFETQYSSITLEEVNAPYSLDSMLIKANETYVRIHKYEFFKKGE